MKYLWDSTSSVEENRKTSGKSPVRRFNLILVIYRKKAVGLLKIWAMLINVIKLIPF